MIAFVTQTAADAVSVDRVMLTSIVPPGIQLLPLVTWVSCTLVSHPRVAVAIVFVAKAFGSIECWVRGHGAVRFVASHRRRKDDGTGGVGVGLKRNLDVGLRRRVPITGKFVLKLSCGSVDEWKIPTEIISAADTACRKAGIPSCASDTDNAVSSKNGLHIWKVLWRSPHWKPP